MIRQMAKKKRKPKVETSADWLPRELLVGNEGRNLDRHGMPGRVAAKAKRKGKLRGLPGSVESGRRR
jgi:hypothetical protein